MAKGKKNKAGDAVAVEDGRRMAHRVVMADENGRAVERVAVTWPLDDMLRRRSIDATQYAAAQAFRDDWHLIGAGDGYVIADLLRCGGAGWREPDPTFTGRAAETRVRALFFSTSEAIRSLLMTVVGDGMTVAWWVRKYTAETGQAMNNHRAAGLLSGALDLVALYYGINRSPVERKEMPPPQGAAERRARRNLGVGGCPPVIGERPAGSTGTLSLGPVDMDAAAVRAARRYRG